jgi:hypothetical protein
MTPANRIIFFIVVGLYSCFGGAVIRAFSNNSVVEEVSIHYPCFGQRTAFFALQKNTTDWNAGEALAENG